MTCTVKKTESQWPQHPTITTATMERLPLFQNDAFLPHLFLRQHRPDPMIPRDSDWTVVPVGWPCPEHPTWRNALQRGWSHQDGPATCDLGLLAIDLFEPHVFPYIWCIFTDARIPIVFKHCQWFFTKHHQTTKLWRVAGQVGVTRSWWTA